MILAYCITLFFLVVILVLLWKEENRVKKNITHGLASKFWILRERRRFVRFNKEIKIRYNLLEKTTNNYFAKTNNISRKGLCLVTYEKLKEKSCINLEMELDGFSKPIKLVGQVVWSKDLQKQDSEGRRLFYIGVRVTKILPENEAMLLVYLNKLKPYFLEGEQV